MRKVAKISRNAASEAAASHSAIFASSLARLVIDSMLRPQKVGASFGTAMITRSAIHIDGEGLMPRPADSRTKSVKLSMMKNV